MGLIVMCVDSQASNLTQIDGSMLSHIFTGKKNQIIGLIFLFPKALELTKDLILFQLFYVDHD